MPPHQQGHPSRDISLVAAGLWGALSSEHMEQEVEMPLFSPLPRQGSVFTPARARHSELGVGNANLSSNIPPSPPQKKSKVHSQSTEG